MAERVNPIKDNRIVYDHTFAVRLRAFLEHHSRVMDSLAEQEKEYLLFVANRLIDYQVNTVTENDEIKDLKSMGVDTRTVEFKRLLSKSGPHAVTHIKTGNRYYIVGLTTNTTNAADGQEMVIYCPSGEHTMRYCREIGEFVSKFTW